MNIRHYGWQLAAFSISTSRMDFPPIASCGDRNARPGTRGLPGAPQRGASFSSAVLRFLAGELFRCGRESPALSSPVPIAWPGRERTIDGGIRRVDGLA